MKKYKVRISYTSTDYLMQFWTSYEYAKTKSIAIAYSTANLINFRKIKYANFSNVNVEVQEIKE